MKIPFKRVNILLPKNTDMTKWSVVACDQYTSEPEYWNSVKEIVGENPSTLNLNLLPFPPKRQPQVRHMKITSP